VCSIIDFETLILNLYEYMIPLRKKGDECTPSVSDLEVILDKVWMKHWEYKSSITFKLLILQM
jgi:hypothetical protein